jgi:nucleotide-binding universal stress UspA family protein
VALHRYAVEGGFALIAVGTRGAGITKAVLGSAATELAHASTIPVLLVPGEKGPAGGD